MTRAQEAYKKIIDTISANDHNPTYALAGRTIENIVGKQARIEMTIDGLIQYVGLNSNGVPTYKIR